LIKPDYVLYAGGGILKPLFIDAVEGKIINAHSGPLPQIRGMNACEWALLLKLPPTVTIHFIDKGIDTGRIITKATVDRYQNDDIDTLRARCVVVGVEQMIKIMNKKIELNTDNNDGEKTEHTQCVTMSRQCFVLAPVLRDLLNDQLTDNNEK
jgi:folate-dependent phosphoribosylglycinamide formyltransferase PurN